MKSVRRSADGIIFNGPFNSRDMGIHVEVEMRDSEGGVIWAPLWLDDLESLENEVAELRRKVEDMDCAADAEADAELWADVERSLRS